MFGENVKKWAEDRDILKEGTRLGQLQKLEEEKLELIMGLAKDNPDEIKDAIGDMSVVLAVIAAMCGTTLEECQELAWNEIKDRKGKMVKGVFHKEEKGSEWEWHYGTGEEFTVPEGQQWEFSYSDTGVVDTFEGESLAYFKYYRYRRVK